jgi:hypothetical protein
MNTQIDTSRSDALADDLSMEIQVYVAKPMRGYSDVTLTEADGDGQVFHQDRIKAGDAEARREYLDEAVHKHPYLAGVREDIDRQISQQKLEWDKPAAGADASGDGADQQAKFWRQDNSIVWTNKGKPVPLCNFYAEIVNDIVVTDGVENRRYFEVRVEMDGRPPLTRVIPAGKFDGMDWISDVGGWYTVAGEVPRCNKLVAEAVKGFSLTHGEKIQYAHTGWIRQDDKMKFLTASGALGEEGLDDSLKTMVESDTDHLSYYNLVKPPTGADLTDAVRSTLRLLQLSRNASKIWPLVGTLYATPVMELDYSIFCSGRTGAFKSSTQRLFLAHLGVAWCDRPLPSFKNATAVGLLLLQFVTKDVVLLIDDYQRPSTKAGTERMNNLVQSIFQNQADRGGRIKGNADGTRHYVKPPRCGLMANGEDVVPGLSTAARQLVISFQAGDIDKIVLAECQKAASEGYYVRAYSDYIRWLAADYERIREKAAALQLKCRDLLGVDGQHGRTAETLSQALVGINLYLDWCKSVNAISEEECQQYFAAAIVGLLAIGAEQRTEQDRQDPVTVFLESILEALASGRCHVTYLDGSMPGKNPNRFGWAMDENGQHSRWNPKGPCIGYLDKHGNLGLMLKTALTVLQKDSPAGEMLTIGQVELGKQLAKADKIVKDGEGNNTKPVKVEGASVRLTCLKAEVLGDLLA